MSRRYSDDHFDAEGINGVESMRAPSEKLPAVEKRHVRKVGRPQRQNMFTEFANLFKETFFADDPFRTFKDQPRSKKFVLGLEAVFPILQWGREYSFAKFKSDVIAGITIASLCIPQDIAYAKLANLPPQHGLCDSLAPYNRY